MQIRTDSTCARSYLSKMGGIKSSECNGIANLQEDLVLVAVQERNKNWILEEFIPGSENPADKESREIKERT